MAPPSVFLKVDLLLRHGRERAPIPWTTTRRPSPLRAQPPAPPQAAPPAHGRASTTHNRVPTFSQIPMDAGSPPCSPQMPSLIPGRVFRPRSAADLNEFADAFRIKRNEWIDFENTLREVIAKECARVVTAQAISRLGKVVCAE